MSGNINLTAIYIANIMGFIISFIMFAGNRWKLSSNSRENQGIKHMILITLSASVLEPASFTFDGKAGEINRLMVYLSNYSLFVTNILICPLWISVIIRHIKGHVPQKLKIVTVSMCAFELLVLMMNFFVPVVFSVTDENRYVRGPAFFLFMTIDIVIILSGLFVYVKSYMKGESLRFFPVWQFVLPLIVGSVIQGMMYGVSTIWPFVSVSVSSIINSLHNETAYTDRLTGLYNRYYLDSLKQQIAVRKNADITAMMLDMNDFKSINDNYGHSEGDEALIIVSGILKESVGMLGTAVRYAGDEFVILLNTQQEKEVEQCISSIRTSIDDFNRSGRKKYMLSLSIGCCSLDLKNQTIDELLKEVDYRMYEDKKEYYRTNPRSDRRSISSH